MAGQGEEDRHCEVGRVVSEVEDKGQARDREGGKAVGWFCSHVQIVSHWARHTLRPTLRSKEEGSK